MAQFTSYLPNATVWLLPMCTHVLYEGLHHRPQRTIERFTITLKAPLTAINMDAIQYFTEHVKLFLICRTVTNTYRMRVLVATEMRKLTLGQIPLTPNTIHYLQVFTIGIRKTAQPIREGTSLFRKTEHIQCIQGKGGIA